MELLILVCSKLNYKQKVQASSTFETYSLENAIFWVKKKYKKFGEK